MEGLATVLSPDALIQLDNDIKAATISLDFSKGQVERFRQSKSVPAQTLANAERQARTDENQLQFLDSRFSQSWGPGAPFIDHATRAALIPELSAGTKALVRLDFPETIQAVPRNVRIAGLQNTVERPILKMWEAPSGNLAMPGTSYFGLIESAAGLRAGDRARLLAERADASAGTLIPSAAIVVFGGQTWCYVETAPKEYERRPVSLEHPVGDGFLVPSGFPAGTRVVVSGASVLLAREAGPGESDDDDGGSAEAPKAPETKTPETKTPETKAPEAKSPETKAPETSTGPDDDAKSPASPVKPAAAEDADGGGRTNSAGAGDDDDDKAKPSSTDAAAPKAGSKTPAKDLD